MAELTHLEKEKATQYVAQKGIVGKATGLGTSRVEILEADLVRAGIPEDLVRRSIAQKAQDAKPPVA